MASTPGQLSPQEEISPTIAHIADSPRSAKEKKTKTCLRHLGVFLAKYHGMKEFESLNISADSDPHQLSYSVINSEEFVGRYMNWLATEACHLESNKSNVLLAYSTVAGYASTFSTYYINHFRDHPNGVPKPLRHEVWPKKMALLTQKKQDYHHKQGTKMKEEKETATDDDRRNLARVCILEATPMGAEMFHITNTAVTLAGRGSDVADADLSHISSQKKTEGLLTYDILVQDTTRFKTSTQSDHQIFPHRDEFFFCFYFSLAYLLVIASSTFDSVKLFPNFAEKVFDSEQRVDSKVATFFNKCIDYFWQLMYDYARGKETFPVTLIHH